MTRSELVRLSGISKQQLSRLENGQIRLRLDHLKPFAPHLGYTTEQMLLWGHLPGTGEERSSDRSHSGSIFQLVLCTNNCTLHQSDFWWLKSSATAWRRQLPQANG